MTIKEHCLRFVLSVSLSSAGPGCATLPKVSDVIDGAPARDPPQIVSARGFLSPEKSRALMERLNRSVAPTDMLQRYTAVIETVSGSPLTHGNKVTLLVATAGRFRQPYGVDGLLRRIGAISRLAGIRYWSATRKRWQTLIIGARALSDAAGDLPREDFSPGEMTEGRSLHFQQEDNISGKATYRMRLRTVSPDRLVIDTENVGTVRYLLMPIAPPAGIQSITFLDRESQDVWRYCSVTRTGRAANPLIAGNEASSINRAVAYYRYLAGIPTDREPPAAP